MLPHTGLFLLWKVALQMRIRLFAVLPCNVIPFAMMDARQVNTFPIKINPSSEQYVQTTPPSKIYNIKVLYLPPMKNDGRQEFFYFH